MQQLDFDDAAFSGSTSQGPPPNAAPATSTAGGGDGAAGLLFAAALIAFVFWFTRSGEPQTPTSQPKSTPATSYLGAKR